MTENPTEQEIKEFWEGCGWRQLSEGSRGFHHERGEKVMNWLPPDNNDYVYGQTYLPRIDLNNLFRWAVPKLKEFSLIYFITFDHRFNEPDIWLVTVNMETKSEWLEYEAENKDPAFALAEAIEKALIGE